MGCGRGRRGEQPPDLKALEVPEVTAEDLGRKHETATGRDEIRPRHIALLSQECLEAAAGLINAMRRTCHIQHQVAGKWARWRVTSGPPGDPASARHGQGL